jgi:tetratricopeptide (TPR) repeat protein
LTQDDAHDEDKRHELPHEQEEEPKDIDAPELARADAASQEISQEEAAGEADEADAQEPWLLDKLIGSPDPLGELRVIADEIRRKEIDADIDPDAAPPSVDQAFLAQQLHDAGLDDKTLALPAFDVVRLLLTGLYYIRPKTPEISYAAKLRLIALEAALNAAHLIHTWCENAHSEGKAEPSLEEAYQLYHGFVNGICLQIPNVERTAKLSAPHTSGTYEHAGEWAFRNTLSNAIERLKLPLRLEENFRCNLALGDVAFEINMTPLRAFWRTQYVEGIGLVPTTAEMRGQESSRYALRVGIVLAACAFHCSERIRHVWVQGTLETPSRHTCYFHVRFDRSAFVWLEMDNIVDPISCYLCMGGHLEHKSGVLQPIEQGFTLDDPRFCPPRRFELPHESKRVLDAPFAHALGSDKVSDLAIDIDSERAQTTDAMLRHFGTSTRDNVETLFKLAETKQDPCLRMDAERTAQKLISGQIQDSDTLAIRDEFLYGGALPQSVNQAGKLMQRGEFSATKQKLLQTVEPLEEKLLYHDTDQEIFRFFESYVDRTFFNRLHTTAVSKVRLVPQSYVNAVSMLARSSFLAHDLEQALRWSRRSCEVQPMSAEAHVMLGSSLIAAGDLDGAQHMLVKFLEEAHSSRSAGMAYHKLAQIAWAHQEFLLAEACYMRVMSTVLQPDPSVLDELINLEQYMGKPDTLRIDTAEVEDVLKANDIPLAPSERMQAIFFEGLAASLDAEIFPVARSFLKALAVETGNDVVVGVLRSLENEPDY